jgi:hypothetical protein
LLVPYLENAGLEEDEFLQDKWATMLGNMLDSEQNIENNIFPFILSQISKNEFEALNKELTTINGEIVELQAKLKFHNDQPDQSLFSRNYREIKNLQKSIQLADYLKETDLDTHEVANLTRCGLIKAIPVQYGHSKGVKVDSDESYTEGFEIDIEHVEDRYVFTELGKLFLKICNEKSKKE